MKSLLVRSVIALLPALAVLLGTLHAVAQTPPPAKSDSTVYTIVEEMPAFPGGEQELFRFLGQNIKYPDGAIEAGITGTVYITFVVDKDGSITDARVLRGIGGGCDEEALRVVRAMPAWKPGKQRGKPVKVQYNLPIKFTLRETARTEPVHTVVDIRARFGTTAGSLEEYLRTHVQHPASARKAKGSVRVLFEVDRDGHVREPRVVAPLHPELDAEALRVVREMPRWDPAVKDRKLVRSMVEVTVQFPGYKR